MSYSIIAGLQDIEGVCIDKGDLILVFDVYAKVTNIRTAKGKNGQRELVADCIDENGNRFVGYSEEMYVVTKGA